jgi:hypothetical protein
MLEFLTWLEGSALAGALRSSGVWTYAWLNLGHILGISLLFGAVVILDLRLLGLWRSAPLAAIARPTVPVSALGFLIAITSGVLMISFNASEYHGNPFLYIKLPVIALGFVNVLIVTRLAAWRAIGHRELAPREQRQLAVAGFVSLACWLTAVAMGRMIGYW